MYTIGNGNNMVPFCTVEPAVRDERIRLAKERRDKAEKDRVDKLHKKIQLHKEALEKYEKEREKKAQEMKMHAKERSQMIEERRRQMLQNENVSIC